MWSERGEGSRVRRAAVIEEFVLQRVRAAQLLSNELKLDVVHTGASLAQFMSWLERADRARWPHLLVIDLPSSVDSTRELNVIVALRSAGIRVLVLSSLRNRIIARRVVDLGIEAVVSTSDSEEDLMLAADAVLRGGTMITPRVQAVLHGVDQALRLSRQEERALALYASGLTIVEVAERIGVRQDTARKYLKRVRDKFALVGRPARTKLDLARIAWAEGYVSTEHDTASRREPATGT